MFILISPRFMKYFTPKSVAGIAIFPFIILEDEGLKTDKTFVNHEMIHIYQQAELLFFLFIIIYLIEFLARIIQYKNIEKAYRNISFEREAYANETNYNYLKTRRRLSFIKYW